MQTHEVKTTGQGRIFKSSFLEAFTKTGPIISAFTYPPILITLFLIGLMKFETPVSTALLVALAGLFFWTFFEYWMHRWIFHWLTDSNFSKRFHYILHGVHHEYPKDEQRVFMPPLPGILIISMLMIISFLIAGSIAFPFVAGLVLGYCLYAFIHYGIHLNHVPEIIKPLWRHHSLHHFKYEELAFGVSTRLWDRIFRTMPPPQ
jgi:sterol desaturase/sphingolipid hydroxylase (fatty acid hydroxylase superfamily)